MNMLLFGVAAILVQSILVSSVLIFEYCCLQLNYFSSLESAWLMTRDRLPSGTTMQKAYGILDKFKISRTFFVKTDQEGCAIAASDINAANGITPTSTIPESIGVEQKGSEDKPEQEIKSAVKSETVAQVLTNVADNAKKDEAKNVS